MRLIGRERELARVTEALDDVRAGGRRALAITGEAGIGKSALLDAIASRATAMRVLAGRAAEHEREVPFALAVDAFRAAPRGLETIDDLQRDGVAGATGRLRIHRAFAELLGQLARERPVVLLVDDVHWADEASVELLAHLIRRPPAGSHLLVFAARPGAALPEAELIGLAPLDHDASLELLGDAPEREAIAHAARGNPLFLRELARSPYAAPRASLLAAVGREVARPDRAAALPAAVGHEVAGPDRAAALPASLSAAVARELAGLDRAPARLLAGAAVAGDPFDPELAAAAAGVPLEIAALDTLVAHDLIRVGGPGRAFAFRHPLVRRAVYDGLPPGWRLEAHERADAALAARGARPAVRAHHVERYARDGDPVAVAVLRAAAETSAPANAARWYAGALRLAGDAERPALLAPMGFALAAAGRVAEAREALLEAHAAAPSFELTIACAQAENELGLYADARHRLLAARGARVPYELAVTAYHEGRADELEAWVGRAVRAPSGEPVLDAGALGLAALAAAWADRPAAALARAERAEALLARAGDEALGRLPAVALHVTTAQLLCERYAAADASATRILAAGHDGTAVPLRLTRAMARLHLGALDAALADAQTAADLARLQRVPRRLHFALWICALVQHERGETDHAATLAAEAKALPVAPDKLVRSGLTTLAALGAEEQPERALRAAVHASGETVEIADRAWSAWVLGRLVRAALATGDHARAERWALLAGRRGGTVGAARAQIAQGDVRLARGDARSAAALATAATAAADDAGAALVAIEARLLEGRALAAAGDPRGARAALQTAAADAGRAGALRLRNAAARELRALGTQLNSSARRAAGGELTDREAQIAALVGQGRTNREVAAALYLSQKTVANTLTRVYAKVGVHTRAQLARAL